MKKRSFILTILLLIMVVTTLSGCGGNDGSFSFSLSTNEVEIILGEETGPNGEVNTARVIATVDNTNNSTLTYRVINEGVVSATKGRQTSEQVEFIITGLMPGTAKVVIFSAEDSGIYQEVIVNVYQHIEQVAFGDEFKMYIPIGSKMTIRPDVDLNIVPVNSTKSDLRYEITSTNDLGVTIGQTTGVIDATNAVSAGELEIKVWSAYNPTSFSYAIVNIIENIQTSEISVSQSGTVTNNVIQAGKLNVEYVKLVKTKEFFSNTTLTVSLSNHVIEQVEIQTSVDNYKIVEVQKTSSNTFEVKAKELGLTNVNFIINLIGAQEYIESTIVSVPVYVIDAPSNINVNGTMVTDSIDLDVYNNYSDSVKGALLRFTLLPSSVLLENSDISLTFVNGIGITEIDIYDSSLNKIDMSSNKTVIKAGETLYIRADNVRVGQYTLIAVAEDTRNYEPYEQLVSIKVNLKVKEGISSFAFADNTPFYVEKGESKIITLAITPEYADMSSVNFGGGYNNFKVTKLTDYTYEITGLNVGDEEIVFYRANGDPISALVKVYIPLTELSLDVDSPYMNPVIGKKEYDANNQLSKVYVAIGNKIDVDIIYNSGATILDTEFESSKPLIVNNIGNTLMVEKEGVSRFTVTLTGYDDETPGARYSISKSIDVEGYKPISSLNLNVINSSLYNYNKVGYYNISKLSSLTLEAAIYPQTATYSSAITWTITDKSDDGYTSGSLSTTTGLETVFTAELHNRNSDTVIISATVKEFNRTYSQSCTITVYDPVNVDYIVLNNVTNKTIYFDSRNGLDTDENSFTVSASAYPINATNRNLRYMYKASDPLEGIAEPRFSVDATGKIIPLRAGVAYLDIGAEDSFTTATNASVYQRVKVVVQDGKQLETAFHITNAEELKAIGTDEYTMSLYYIVTKDIDLKNIQNWEPIGYTDKLAFTGYLSGQYVAGFGEDNQPIVINSSIMNLSINAQYTMNAETSFGLFYKVSSNRYMQLDPYDTAPVMGTINDLTISVAKFIVDCSKIENLINNEKFNVYIGVVAGSYLVDSASINLIKQGQLEDAQGFKLGVNNVSVKLLSSFTYKTGKNNGYVGGLFGLSNAIITNNTTNSIVSGADIVVIDKIEYRTIGTNSYHTFYPTYYMGGIVGDNRGYIYGYTSFVDDELDGDIIQYVSLYDTQGIEVLSSINSYNIKYDLYDYRENVKSINAAIGGIAGRNKGYIIGCGVENGIYGKNYVGGIAGKNEGMVSGCSVASILRGDDYVGGIAGLNGVIKNPNVNEDTDIIEEAFTIEYCSYEMYEDGVKLGDNAIAIIARNYVGGIVGYSQEGEISYSYSKSYIERNFVAYETSNILEYKGDIVLKDDSGLSLYSGAIVGYSVGALIHNCHSNFNINITSSASAYAGYVTGGASDSTIIKDTYTFSKIVVNNTNIKKAVSLSNGACSIYTSYFVQYDNQKLGELVYYGYNQTPSKVEIYDASGATSTPTYANVTISRFTSFSTDNWFKANSSTVTLHDGVMPLLKYAKDSMFTLVPVVPSLITIEAKNKNIQIGNNPNEITLLLYYYDSENVDERLSVRQKNTYNVRDLINTIIEPLSGRVNRLIISCDDTTIVKVDNSGNLEVVGNGIATVKITSKLNRKVSSNFRVYVTNPITDFDLYASVNSDDGAPKLGSGAGEVHELRIKLDDNWQIKPNTSAHVVVDGVNYLVIPTTNGGIRYVIDIDGETITDYLTFENSKLLTTTGPNGEILYYYDIDLAVQTIINALQTIDSGNIMVSATPYINVKYIDQDNNMVNSIKLLDNLTREFGLSIYVGASDIYLSGASETSTNTDTQVRFKTLVETDFAEEELSVEISDKAGNLLYSKRIASDNEIEESSQVFKVNLKLTNFNNNANAQKKAELEVAVKLQEAYKYISENAEYYISISPSSNSTLSATYKIVYIPQEISRINLTNYSYGEKNYIDYSYNPNEESSNNIVPGYFSLLQIDVYPYYSNYDYIEITNKELSFEQLLKNDTISGYPYVNPNDRIYLENGIRLVNQYYKNGELITGKNGVYYVSMYLSSITILNTDIEVVVKAYRTIKGKATVVASNTIILTSESAPGVTLMYLNNGVYETSKDNNQLYIPIGTSGTMKAIIKDYNEKDVKFLIKNAVTNVEYKYVILEQTSNGEYEIHVLPSATIGDKITIVASVTKTIAGVTVTNTDTLTFTVVDFLIEDIGFEYVVNNRMREVYGGVYPLQISFEKSSFVYDKTNLEIEQRIKDTLNRISSTDYSTWYAYKSGANHTNVALGRYYESTLNPYFIAYTKTSSDKTLYVKGTKYDEVVTNQKRIMANIAYYFDSVTCTWIFDKLGYNVPSRAENNTFGLIKEKRMYNGKYYNIINRVFELDFYNESSRDNAIKIYTVEDFLGIEEGMSYLLLNDLELENYTPIDVGFDYLDGNNHTITIKSFAPISEEENTANKSYGLFTTIHSGTILENLHVKYAPNYNETSFYIDAMPLNGVTFGGLAASNSGTIYNCSVDFANEIAAGDTYANDAKKEAGVDAMGNYIKINGSFREAAKGIVIQITLTPINESYVTSTIGGLVATNSGYITNCRVEDNFVIHGYGTMGTFVAENGGIISSSYSKARLNSYTTDNEVSKIGGFVATNSGKISLSFIEGEYLKDLICEENDEYSYTQASSIANEISGVASIGGFVYENSGEISNSYANVKVNSNSPTAGFVFINSGTISNVYSTSIVRFNSKQDMAFVGLDAFNNVNNTGVIEYSYFLDGEYTGKENQPAILINLDGLRDNGVLSSFAFDVTNAGQLRANSINGVWMLPTSKAGAIGAFGHANVSLNKPTLVSPNLISRGQKDEYGILQDVVLGTKERPYVIYSAQEFNTYILEGAADGVNNKWYILANDITFNNTDLMIDTYKLSFGGRFEGNNMSINNIRLSYLNYNTTNNVESMGMFASLDGAVFMNIDLNVTEVFGTKAVRVGTLAGTITRSKVYNIGVYGEMVIQAQNVVGGLAGVVEGSVISDIDISISVNSGLRNAGIVLYNGKNISSVSYAGSAIGFVIKDATEDNSDLLSGLKGSNITSYVHSIHVGGMTKIIGEMCGGVIGYIENGSIANLLDIKVTNDMYIRATTLIGGLVAENRGTLVNSYAQYTDDVQAYCDTISVAARYIHSNDSFFKIDTNSNIMAAKQVSIGGLVGYNNEGIIKTSYSKLNISCENAMVAGGLVGRAYAGVIDNVYASGYVYIGSYDTVSSENTTTMLRKIVGGIIGVVSANYGSSAVDNDFVPKKLKLSNVVAVNNWQADHARYLSGALILEGSIIGAIHNMNYLDTTLSYTNYYNNVHVNELNITREHVLHNNSTQLHPIGSIRRADIKDGIDDTNFVSDRTAAKDETVVMPKFGTGYDIFALHEDGVEVFNDRFGVYVYDPWPRGFDMIEGRKTQVFSSHILNNFQFNSKDDRFPTLRTNYTKLAISEMLQIMDNGSYAISQKYHFDLMAFFINDAQYNAFTGYSFEMVRDINFAGQHVSPIGGKVAFKGRFNGNGFAIRNMEITDESVVTVNSINCYGLFGYANNASIRNFGLDESCIIDVTNVTKNSNVGIIAYAVDTNISGIYSYATYNVSTNKNSNVGGIIGHNVNNKNNNTIANCFIDTNELLVTGNSVSYVGGLVGNTTTSGSYYTIISNCYSDALINIGSSSYYAGIANSTSKDKIYNSWASFSYSAGMSAASSRIYAISKNATLSNCYVFTNATSDTYNSTNVANIPHSQLINKYWYINISYWNATYIWDFADETGVWVANENKYPTLRNSSTINSSVSIYSGIGEYDKYAKYYIVRTEQNLKNLASMISSGEIVGGGSDLTLVLANDITLKDWVTPIGTFKAPFRGQFIGLGHTITIQNDVSLGYEEDYAYGLFGRLDNAVVKHVNVVYNGNIHISNTNQSTYLGGIAGLARAGIIANCNVTINNTITLTTAGQFGYLGGLVGQIDNQTVRNCIVNLTENGRLLADYADREDNTYSVRVGGLVGYAKKQQLFVIDNAVIISNAENIGVASMSRGVVGMLFGYVRENDSTSVISHNHLGVTSDDITLKYGVVGIGTLLSGDENTNQNLSAEQTKGKYNSETSVWENHMFENDEIWMHYDNWAVESEEEVFINTKGSKEEFALYVEKILIKGEVLINNNRVMVLYTPRSDIETVEAEAKLYDYIDTNVSYNASYDAVENEIFVSVVGSRTMDIVNPANGFDISFKFKLSEVFASGTPSTTANKTIWKFKNSSMYLSLELTYNNRFLFKVAKISQSDQTQTSEVNTLEFKNAGSTLTAQTELMYDINISLRQNQLTGSISCKVSGSMKTYNGSKSDVTTNINSVTQILMANTIKKTGIGKITSTTSSVEIYKINNDKLLLVPVVSEETYTLVVYSVNNNVSKKIVEFKDLKLSTSTSITGAEVQGYYSTNGVVYIKLIITVNSKNYEYIGSLVDIDIRKVYYSIKMDEPYTIWENTLNNVTYKVRLTEGNILRINRGNAIVASYQLSDNMVYKLNITANYDGYVNVGLNEGGKEDTKFERTFASTVNVYKYSLDLLNGANAEEVYNVEGFGNTIPVIKLGD